MKAKLVNPTNLAEPSIVKVIPNIGATEKATEIAIMGSGLVEGAEIQIGNIGCQNVQYISENAVYCTAPPQPVSKVAVRVTNPNAKVFELADAFSYIDAIAPVSGFTISAGGGISRGTTRMLTSTIGEGGSPAVLKSQTRTLKIGNEALQFDDSN